MATMPINYEAHCRTSEQRTGHAAACMKQGSQQMLAWPAVRTV